MARGGHLCLFCLDWRTAPGYANPETTFGKKGISSLFKKKKKSQAFLLTEKRRLGSFKSEKYVCEKLKLDSCAGYKSAGPIVRGRWMDECLTHSCYASFILSFLYHKKACTTFVLQKKSHMNQEAGSMTWLGKTKRAQYFLILEQSAKTKVIYLNNGKQLIGRSSLGYAFCER